MPTTAVDQTTAMEDAAAAGTLPEEDRRAPEDAVEEVEVVSDRAEVDAEHARIVEKYRRTDDLLAALPLGSRVEFTRGEPDKFVVYRGAGVAQHGEGKTLARAIRVIGAGYEHVIEDGRQTSRMILVDEAGVPIPPED